MNPENNNVIQTDLEILKAFLEGDGEAAQSAFEKLVRRYERLVWSICRNQLNNRCDIEDAIQATFALLATRAHRIRNPQSLASWLYGAAWKIAARIRNRSRREVEMDDTFDRVSADETPFEIIARKFQFDTLNHQLKRLDEKYRTPLVLFYFAQLSARQISEQLGISVSAVEGRLRRGRTRLRIAMSAQGSLFSPLLIAFASRYPFIACPDRAAIVSRKVSTTNCLTWANAKAALAKLLFLAPLETGTKLMICKSLVLVAMSAMMVGGYLHSPAAWPTQENASLEIAPAPARELHRSSVLPQEQDQEATPESKHRITDAVHHHLAHLHHHFISHAHHLMHMFHQHLDAQEQELHHRKLKENGKGTNFKH